VEHCAGQRSAVAVRVLAVALFDDFDVMVGADGVA
jgi:hypothetical protein